MRPFKVNYEGDFLIQTLGSRVEKKVWERGEGRQKWMGVGEVYVIWDKIRGLICTNPRAQGFVLSYFVFSLHAFPITKSTKQHSPTPGLFLCVYPSFHLRLLE